MDSPKSSDPAPSTRPEPELMLAPDIGALFYPANADGSVERGYENSHFMVTGWMKQATPPAPDPAKTAFQQTIADILFEACREFGPRQQRLVWCRREDATHVTGTGVCGCLHPIDMIRVVGRASLSASHLDDLREQQAMFIGEVLF